MATFNTTYNFNQKSPSFWQSFGMGMLYQGMGAFGSLTGCGMGMGGYGMGMGGCMGMGGSLFGMGGFGMGSYGMGMYGMGGYGMGMGCCGMSDSQFGAQLGLMGVGMLFQNIMGGIQEHRAAKNTPSEVESQLATVKNDAKSHLTTLDVKSLADFDSNKGVNDYTNEYRAQVTTASGNIEQRQTAINNEKNQLGPRPTAVPEGETKTLAELQTEYDNKL